MTVFLDFRFKGVKAALKRVGLTDKKPLGRGSFCAVFEKGTNVLKLTLDVKQCEFYRQGIDNPVFPRLVRDYGIVGELEGKPIALIETERLEPIQRLGRSGRFVNRLILDYAKAYPCHGASVSDSECSAEALLSLSDQDHLTPDLRNGLLDLAQFVIERKCIADLHAANFMLRGQRVVMNDPIADIENFPII